MPAMNRSDFHFELPPELIAQQPPVTRTASRLLCLNRHNGDIHDHSFIDLLNFVRTGDLLVMNNTKVIPARLFANKETGGKVEIMLERIVDDGHVLAQIRASKAPKRDMSLLIAPNVRFTVQDKQQALYTLSLQADLSLMEVLNRYGHTPLPPYIDRDDQEIDKDRYQTVFAQIPGAVAAPTAGLHFDEAMLVELQLRGANIEYLTLHVGAGTFSPIRVENLDEHIMHSEYIELSEHVCDRIKQTKAEGGRIIAVGTTSVRCMESAARDGKLRSFSGETNIFIRPGYAFKVVDALITNFHLPESTLIMLISAFAGTESVFNAYHHAIAAKYRFYSYGDAMFISDQLMGEKHV